MSGEEKLYRAIGEIDDSIIEEALRPAKSVGFSKKVGGIALAASLAIVTVAVVIGNSGLFAPKFDNDMSGGDGYYGDVNDSMENAPGNDNTNGGEIYGKAGYIKELYRTDGKTFEFTLVIEYPELLSDITLYGTEDADGESVTHVFTTGNKPEVDGVVYHTPDITVNGVAADALPSTVGSYRITVTFEGINDTSVEWRNYFTVGGIGNLLR